MLETQSQQVADDASESTGIAVETILPIVIQFLPMILQTLESCLDQDESPAEFVKSHYDELTGDFDQHLIDRMRPRVRRAEIRAGVHQRLSRSELDAISEAALHRAMSEGETGLSSCMAEAGNV